MKLWRLLCAALCIALLPLTAVTPSRADVDVYTTPGTHTVGGRLWKTDCVPYSQTRRCTTFIWGTRVSQVKGRFVQRNDWVFNNLTYEPSARSLWKANPLGGNGVYGAHISWTAKDGRRWETRCDDAVSGRNGCRAYAEARVLEAYQAGSRTSYRWVTKLVFNNIVRFATPSPAPAPAPAPAVDLSKVVDPALRGCIADAAGVAPTGPLTLVRAAQVTFLDCTGLGIRTLAGMPSLPNLDALWLGGNALTNLSGFPRLPSLTHLELYENQLTAVTGLPVLPKLAYLDVMDNQLRDLSALPALPDLATVWAGNNRLSDLSGLPDLPKLLELSLDGNQVRDFSFLSRFDQLAYLDVSHNGAASLASLPNLPNLTGLVLTGNGITHVGNLPEFPALMFLVLDDNEVSSVAPLATRTGLLLLFLEGNPVTDVETLQPLVDAGCAVDIWEP
ncbi:hypothetical protein LKO27_12925 [Tessaracoccus sp. OS52]|uniref:leucine-rich repeat domain-containing protein n=1 Tax=Tessaracoccus sp. OS52 TaxID=2886691 RepID=UPI001D1212E4|nr:hypothetical protein [Tessaracoccus sp. OS52]MCC2594309.1 hypothetical protein [Tessaracoccus sp. OS52]